MNRQERARNRLDPTTRGTGDDRRHVVSLANAVEEIAKARAADAVVLVVLHFLLRSQVREQAVAPTTFHGGEKSIAVEWGNSCEKKTAGAMRHAGLARRGKKDDESNRPRLKFG